MSSSNTVIITIKHGKKKHKGIELDLSSLSFEGLQAVIMSLTQVSPQRQKIVIKGKKVESEDDLPSIKNKCILTVVGSAESSANSIDQSNNHFVEDMTDKEKQEAMEELPPGLYNLGNTCYLNSTLQCLRGITDLKDNLKQLNNANAASFTNNLGSLFVEMDTTTDAVNPTQFVQHFRTRFPEFATRNEQGAWEQQDADECLTKILTTLKNEGENKIDEMFSGELESSMKCIESEDEPTVEMKESFMKLRCFIDSETRHISYGIERSMEEEVEKNSALLGRNAKWTKKQKISKLPKYLTIAMVRFFWKQSKQKNAKILRSVQFDMKFDINIFCNDKLKTNIGKFRRLKTELEDKQREQKQSKGIAIKDDKNKNDKTDQTNDKNEQNTNENENNDIDMTQPKDETKPKDEEEKKQADNMEIDTNENEEVYESGFYELVGLITHKGLSANSGHYIGYAKDSKRGWLKYDDETVSEVKEDDIKKLYGGGQWQMGYVTFYRKVDAILPS